MLKVSVLSEVVLLLALWSQYSWWERQAIKACSWPTPWDDLQEPNVIIFILVNPLPRLIPRRWKDQPTNEPLLFFLQLFMNSTVGKSWEVELAEFQHSQCAVKQRKFPVKIIHPSTNYLFLSFFSSCPSACQSLVRSLSFSLLRAVAGCFQRKRCRPSGLFINMLNGEQVFGRGNKAKIIINPVRWIHSITLGCIIIGVFFFFWCVERDRLQGQQNCGNFSQTTTRTSLSFFFFPPRLLSAVDGEGEKKKLCVKYNHPTPFICLWKSAAKIFLLLFPPPSASWST